MKSKSFFTLLLFYLTTNDSNDSIKTLCALLILEPKNAAPPAYTGGTFCKRLKIYHTHEPFFQVREYDLWSKDGY